MPPPVVHSEQEDLDLRELVRPVWNRRWLILAIVVISTTALYYVEARKAEVYLSSTKIYVQSSQVEDILGIQSLLDGDRNTTNQAELLRSRAVATVVAKRTGYRGDPAALLGLLTVAPQTGSDFVSISTTGGTPQEAAAFSNAFAKAFIEVRGAAVRNKVVAGRQIAERQLAQLPKGDLNSRAARSTLSNQIKRYRAIEAFPAGNAEQIDEALPGSKIAPKPRARAVFGFAISLVVAVMLAFLLERLDRRVRRMEQMGEVYGLPVLAALPHASETAPTDSGELVLVPDFREAVRGLRTNLQLASIDRPLKTLLVTSAVPSEGKSTLVRSLALAYREAGQRVCVLECDLRKPSVGRNFGVENDPGLTDYLAGGVQLEDTLQYPKAAGMRGVNSLFEDEGGLAVITSGPKPPNPPSVLSSLRMLELLADLRRDYDLVIIDTPPLLAVADTMSLLKEVDGALLIGRIGRTRRDSVERVREMIGRAGDINMVGVIANDVPLTELTGGYGYGYYGYGGYRAYSEAT